MDYVNRPEEEWELNDTPRKPPHRCDSSCELLGHWWGYDVYFHKAGTLFDTPSVIVRWGDGDFEWFGWSAARLQERLESDRMYHADGGLIPFSRLACSDKDPAWPAIMCGWAYVAARTCNWQASK
jgi:hypothetical protein